MDHRLSRLRIRDLQALVAIARLGSLRRAAKEIGVSQPALGASLSEIEDALGKKLFVRGRSGLSGTRFGEAVIAGAEVLLAEFDNFRISLHSTKSPPLRLGCTSFLAQVFLPRWLTALQADAVEIREGPVPSLLDDLDHGRIDAVFGLYPDADSNSDRYTHHLLFTEPLRILAGSELAVGSTWHALSRAPWILPPKNSVIRRTIEANFMAFGLTPPTPSIESMSMATNLRLASSGLGVAAIAQSYFQEERKRFPVKAIRLKPLPHVPISLIFRKGSDVHHRIKAAADALYQELG